MASDKLSGGTACQSRYATKRALSAFAQKPSGAVHNLPRLWAEAGLPTLSNEDLRRLLIVKSLLSWSGRYAAPKTDDQFYQEKTDYEALGPPEPLYSKMGDWENFDRLYQIANGELFEMRAHYGLSPRSADLGLRRRRTRPIA
jgi:hypothetical protein